MWQAIAAKVIGDKLTKKTESKGKEAKATKQPFRLDAGVYTGGSTQLVSKPTTAKSKP